MNAQTEQQGFVQRFFKLEEKHTTVKTELIAGFTTFIALAYIMFVNPNIITGKYSITSFVDDEPDDYNCITILDEFGNSGSTAYVGKNVIFENYKNSNLIPNVK